LTGGQYDALTVEQVNAALAAFCNEQGISPVTVTGATRGEIAVALDAIYTDQTAPVRTTAYGDVKGYTADNGANVWKGIPYAQAQRWAAPEAPDPWEGTLDCTAAGAVAIQYATNYTTGESYVTGVEDCLNLDVYAPDAAQQLPVLVYIHGGNNQTGQSSEIPGTDLVVTNQCVYVSLNYRLGLLGFNCLPALQTNDGDTGNYALLDIAKALDWVKDNIAAFGGDPNNITISGFSAGGRDVMAMLTSPLFQGKFDKAIVYSGGMTIADEDMSAAQIAAAVAPLAVEDGKAADEATAAAWLLTSSADVKEYLMGISAERLAPMMGSANIRMSVFPHLYNDGVVLPKEGFATETYNSVPVLMLTGSGEFSLFNNGGYLASEAYSALDEDTKAVATAFSLKYGSEMYRIFNAQVSADTMAAHYSAPIYVCQVDYDDTAFGAFHGIFVPMLSSTHSYGWAGDFSSTGYTGMAEKFNAYLTSFLRTGDPNGDNTGTQWTPWDPATKLSMVLDGNETGGTAEMKNVSTTYADIIAAMEADTTVSADIKGELVRTVTNGRWFSAAQDEYFNVTSGWVADQK
jgi:para-nitrobenzyl esterase